MKIEFLGTGEAFSQKANTSILIDSEILLDCGMQTLQQIMKTKQPLSEIKMIFISHLHADHFFGIPAFLLACREDGRKNDLEILGISGTGEYIEKLLNLAYRKRLSDFDFNINFTEIKEINGIYREFEFNGYRFNFAPVRHSIPSLSVSVTGRCGKKVTYTSDGEITGELKELAKDSDLLIAEAYMEGVRGHSSIPGALKLLKQTNSGKLALVHISRKEKIDHYKIKEIKGVFVPCDLDEVEI